MDTKRPHSTQPSVGWLLLLFNNKWVGYFSGEGGGEGGNDHTGYQYKKRMGCLEGYPKNWVITIDYVYKGRLSNDQLIPTCYHAGY